MRLQRNGTGSEGGDMKNSPKHQRGDHRLTFGMPEALWRRLEKRIQEECRRTGYRISLGSVVRKALTDHLDGYKDDDER